MGAPPAGFGRPGAIPLGTPGSPGQPPMMAPPGFSGQAVAQAAKTECAVAALDVNVKARRTLALVDVTVRLLSPKGGYCAVRPDAVQITTTRSVGPTRLLGVQYVEGQVVRPMAAADGSGNDRMMFWSGTLAKGEEKVVTFRFLVEGDVSPSGDVDPPARLRIDPRFFGPKLYEGATATAKVSVEPGQKGRAIFSSGNPKMLGAPADYDASGNAKASFVLAREAVNPLLDWRLDTPVTPAQPFEKIGGGLGAIEYLREGLARDLAAGIGDGKDKKKVDEAWDRAFDTAWGAMQSPDPFVSGMGARAIAWLANDLNPAAVEVKASATAADATVFPAKIAFDAGKKEPAADAPRTLARMVEFLKASPSARVVLVPATEKLSDAAKTGELAKERGQSVKKALTDAGIAPARIAVKDATKPPAGAPELETRRVEVRLDVAATVAAPEPPEGLEVIAAEATKALAGFAALTGIAGGAPAAHTNRGLRTTLAKLGEPGSHRKDVSAAIKRLVDRVKGGKAGISFGEVLTTALVAPASPSTVSPNARMIVATLKGTQFVGASTTKGSIALRSPMAGRFVREIAGHRGTNRFGFGFLVAVLLGLGLAAGLRARLEPEPVRNP